MDAEELSEFYYDHLKWCGCGEPWAALSFLGEVLAAIDQRHPEGVSEEESHAAYMKLFEVLGMEANPGLAYGYLYSIDAYGLLEHGSTIRGSWLTAKGKEVMKAIQNCSKEEFRDA